VPQIPSGYRPLRGSERTVRHGAKRTGAADPSEIFTVSVRIRRRSDAPPLPDFAALAAVPRGGRRHLSREEFAARYGASEDDLAKIAAFAAANGLSVVESSVPRRTVVLEGTVAQMNKAFAVDLGTYETADEKYRGREGPIYLPAAIADIVEGVFGLDNRKMLLPHFAMSKKTADAASTDGTMPLTPPQVAQLYNFPTWPATGQTIGILEFGGGYLNQDLKLFFDNVGMPVPSIAWVGIGGRTNEPTYPDLDGTTTETIIDITVAGSAAPGARLIVYIAPSTEQGYAEAVSTAIHDAAHAPSVISISYGLAEKESSGNLNWTLSNIQSVHSTFQEAAVLGVTVVASSGDDGTNAQINDGKAHVEYPASDPYVTAVGGTTISNLSGSTFTEYTWNDNESFRHVTGGGISEVFCPPNFPLPPWQSFVRVPGSVNDGHNGRGVPDVAGWADPNCGFVFYLYGDVYFGGLGGGTSVAAPLYAALFALLNAGLGEPIGYLNPTLYAAPAYVFRDIADGKNNARPGVPAYVSGPGWDACTGLGVVNGLALKYFLEGGPDALSPLLTKLSSPS
jgi:kumamolisin